jgi:hypothetical protein
MGSVKSRRSQCRPRAYGRNGDATGAGTVPGGQGAAVATVPGGHGGGGGT